MLIRVAQASDSKNLAALAESTFRDTFSESNTKEDMDLHCRTSYSEAIQLDEIINTNLITLLCESDGELVGFAQVRWGTAPSCVGAKNPGEIQRLYVSKKWHGRGLAQDLMKACILEIEKHGSDVVWLGVWERNPRAIAFYKKFGFVKVGDHVFPLGTDPQRDIIMVRNIEGYSQRA